MDSNTNTKSTQNLPISAPLDPTQTLKLLSRVSENTLITLVTACDSLRSEYDLEKNQFRNEELKERGIDITQFKASMIQLIGEKNQQIYKELNLSPKDYIDSMLFYLNVEPNEKIKMRSDSIEKVFKSFNIRNNINLNINFPKEITENFLKIITNTFYLTLKKVTLQLKSEIFDENIKISYEELSKKIDDYYSENVKEIRKKIFQFFNLKNCHLKRLSMIRSYVFTLPVNDEVRKKYEYYSQVLNKIEDNLKNRIIAEEFVDKTNKFYTDDVQNEIVELDRLVQNTIDYKMIN